MATKRTKQRATVLYVPDVKEVRMDEVRDSNWCFKESVQLEDGVRLEFKAGNSVSDFLNKLVSDAINSSNKHFYTFLLGFRIEFVYHYSSRNRSGWIC
jgi:hypothetical protein